MFRSLRSVAILLLISTTGHAWNSSSSATELAKTSTDNESIAKTEKPCQDCEETSKTNKCSGDHEAFVNCLSTCPSRTCNYFLNRPECPERNNVTSKEVCTAGCQCQEGYYRHAEGMCVLAWRCKLSSSDPKWKNSTKKSGVQDAYNLFVRGDLAFTGKLFIQMLQVYPKTNFIGGGTGPLVAIAELAANSVGQTYKQIMAALNFQDLQQLRIFFQAFIKSTRAQQFSYSRYLTKLYGDKQCVFNEDFKEETKKIFPYEPSNIDFNDPESAGIINEQVANATDNSIRKIISPQRLSSLSCILMVIAESFKGEWESQFDPNNTKDRVFMRSKCNSTHVPTMYKVGKFLYTESAQADAKVLKMRYLGGNYTCAIVLPNRSSTIEQVVKRMANPDVFIKTFDSLQPEIVEVYLPIFDVLTKTALKKYVEKADVTKIFDQESSGLKGITKNGNTYVDQILHKLTFQINERGTNVSDTSSSCSEHTGNDDGSDGLTCQPKKIFNANCPFAFYLLHKKIVLYYGIFNG